MGIALPLLMPQALQIPDSPCGHCGALREGGLAWLAPCAACSGALSGPLRSAGELIDLQRGATAASVFNPFFGAVTSPTANLLMRFCAAIFFLEADSLPFFRLFSHQLEISLYIAFSPSFSPAAGSAMASFNA
jgi:hypothetical protein